MQNELVLIWWLTVLTKNEYDYSIMVFLKAMSCKYWWLVCVHLKIIDTKKQRNRETSLFCHQEPFVLDWSLRLLVIPFHCCLSCTALFYLMYVCIDRLVHTFVINGCSVYHFLCCPVFCRQVLRCSFVYLDVTMPWVFTSWLF